LIEFLKKTALNYAYLYSKGPVKDLKFCTAWANLMFQGCEIKNHNDSYYNTEKSLIVTFYPKAPAGGSNLVFIHQGKEGDWPSNCLEENLVRITIEEGDIVIFDNFVFHAVDAHRLNETRMCIAVEFTIEI
jgi:Rps23 Pro-64 3,4-dihydroxylase Tpa1-like proline 4-hydroxylase